MISNPKWLPLKINTDGVWETVLIKLYKVFNNDFKKINVILIFGKLHSITEK